MDKEDYTPRDRLEGTLNNIQTRKSAVSEIVGPNRKAPQRVIYYLNGYYDALHLVEAEVRQAKDDEIMAQSPYDEGENGP